jgi:glycosyltransferase involved in cell wall biosynthesis
MIRRSVERVSSVRRAQGRRVLLVADGLGAGGAERQLGLLATNLPSEWQCMVWSLGGGPFKDVLRRQGIVVQVAERSFRLDPRPLVSLLRTVRLYRPDVVHSWGWMSSLACLVVCRLHHVAFVNGGIRTGGRAPRRKWLSELIAGRSGALVANSRSGLVAWKVSPGKGRVVYNGFDFRRLAGLSCVKGDRDRFEVVMVAAMRREKDFSLFCEAARHLDRTEPGRWRFKAIGDGPLRTRLLRDYRRVIARGSLEFAGFVEEVLPILASADVGVLLTDATVACEGCSNAIMEYMACGLPVLCTDGGGNQELVESGRTGLVIPTGSLPDLLNGLGLLRNDQNLRNRMGEAGARRLLANHTPSRMAEAFVSVYEDVVDWHGRRR